MSFMSMGHKTHKNTEIKPGSERPDIFKCFVSNEILMFHTVLVITEYL